MVSLRSLWIVALASLGATSAIKRQEVQAPPDAAVSTDCIGFDTVMTGDTCWDIIARHGNTFTMSQLLCWNAEINHSCSNLIPGRRVCVKVEHPDLAQCE